MFKILFLIFWPQLTIAQFNVQQFESDEISLPSVLNVQKSSYSDDNLLPKESLDVYGSRGEQKCQEITVPMCRNIEYNMTAFPNQFNHESQQEAAAEAHQFWPLVEINCAKDLKFFLCSMYTPICVPSYPQSIKACKSVCVRARLGCEKYMKKFGFEWPEHMNCDLFPEYGTSEVCMDPMDAEEQKKHQILHQNSAPQKTIKINENFVQNKHPKLVNTYANEIVESELANKNRQFDTFNKVCTHPFIKITDPNDHRFNKVSFSELKNCAQPCQSVYFSHQERQLTYYWSLFWSFLCLFSTFCTACTYFIESSRFRYPQKPIIYMSICFLFISIGYMVRFMTGHEQACESDKSIRYSNSNNLSSLPCTLTFMLTYYFGMAASVWWVIISLTWFLAAGLKWSTEAISKYGAYFHLVAWLVPFIKTFTILTMSLVDGDPLSGMCFVGNLNVHSLKIFVIYPSVIYLSIGMGFLIAGFVSLARIRNMIKKQHADLKKAHKLEKLMIRIGIFSILYTVPASCVIACQVYEYHYRSEWEKSVLCRNRNYGKNFHIKFEQDFDELVGEFCSSVKSNRMPEFSIFLVKYFMSLIIGITSGFWIWTSKSLDSWKKFIRKIFGYKNSNEDSDSETSDIESYCFPVFSPKKKVCRLQKNSVIYFQANDEEKYQSNPYEIDNLKINDLNLKCNQYGLNQPMLYHGTDTGLPMPFKQNIPCASLIGNKKNLHLFNQGQNGHSNPTVFVYDYSASTLYKNLPPTINTTSSTNASSMPSANNK
ncbi:frizzled-8 [Brachionus plicatilis]|uniref:Frizzled-8 n=1 Tax=Brachionus plicatilis TaxID=10195 RepID=A0A3M7RVM5_BRAPC|nr:frizzled-8 [Brachionus plicatilis]